MKKIVVTLVLLSLILSGCNSNESSSSKSESKVTVSNTSEDLKTDDDSATNKKNDQSSDPDYTESESFADTKKVSEPDIIPSKSDIKIQDIYNANMNDSVLEKYNSIQTTMSVDGEDRLLYADKDFTYVYGGDEHYGRIGEQTCFYEDDEFMTEVIYDRQKINLYDTIFFMFDYFKYFVVTDVQEEGDDLIITSQMHTSDTEDFMDDMNMDTEYEDGDIAVSTFTVDAKSLIIKESTIDIVNGNDSKTFVTVSNKFNCDIPSQAQKIYEHMTSSEIRSITLILNPGAGNEYTISTSGIKGDEVEFVSLSIDNYTDVSTYKDEKCTDDFDEDEDDKYSDLIIYGIEE